MIVLLTIAIVGLAFALIGVRMLVLDGGFFRGTCATNGRFIDDETGECTYCADGQEEPCLFGRLRRLRRRS